MGRGGQDEGNSYSTEMYFSANTGCILVATRGHVPLTVVGNVVTHEQADQVRRGQQGNNLIEGASFARSLTDEVRQWFGSRRCRCCCGLLRVVVDSPERCARRIHFSRRTKSGSPTGRCDKWSVLAFWRWHRHSCTGFPIQFAGIGNRLQLVRCQLPRRKTSALATISL